MQSKDVDSKPDASAPLAPLSLREVTEQNELVATLSLVRTSLFNIGPLVTQLRTYVTRMTEAGCIDKSGKVQSIAALDPSGATALAAKITLEEIAVLEECSKKIAEVRERARESCQCAACIQRRAMGGRK